MIRIRSIPVLLVVLVATASTAVAQTPFGPGLRASRPVFAPDFGRADLEILEEDLALQPGQVSVVETLFEEYDRVLRASAQDVRATIRERRVGAPGLTDERRERLETLRTETRRLREEARTAAEAAGDPDLRRQVWRDYAEKVRTLHEATRGENDGTAEATKAAFDEAIAAHARAVAAWTRRKATLEAGFIANVRAILDDEQQTLWPAFERKWRRLKTMMFGTLSGESVNLFTLLVMASRDKETPADVAEVLAAYDLRLDAALQTRNAVLEQLHLVDAGRATPADRSLARRVIETRRAVRDVNDEVAGLLAATLPGESGTRFARDYRLRADPQIYRPTPGQRLVQAALEIPDLDEGTREVVFELGNAFALRLAPVNETFRAGVRQFEPEYQRWRLERETNVESAARPPNDATASVVALRRTMDDELVAGLRTLITPEQFKRLPGASRFGVERGAPRRTGLEQAGWVMDRFDADGDGRLDPGELEALREFLRTRPPGDR